ncbi:CBS domain-containing protein [Streptomyces sp. HNM0663]|uniref:CBS domain-containing protein n=1 Tax=Streptomyces chengmaiensis TaxID=3040919 RepID=A0ABT6HGR7_9ACTN|nr:CBS domain-containing protein [Streptomyces chengmaiensis]MDH2387959.1 CBS domain-containing protein [Streptomyces chengmaiensis]
MDGRPYTVNDVMTRTVVSVDRDARFKEIAAAIERWQVSAVPVIEGEGRVVGVVSEADLLPKEEFRSGGAGMVEQRERAADTAKAGAVCAKDLMTTPAVVIRADATLPQAARVMARQQVKRLPVVDAEGVLQGIVSRADLLKVFLRSDDELAFQVRAQVVDRLFPVSRHDIRVEVCDGVVHLTGTVRDSERIPLAESLTRSVEGVVDVVCSLTGPPLAAASSAPSAPSTAG